MSDRSDRSRSRPSRCRTDQIDHDLDPLDPNLSLCDDFQDLCSSYPTQETCPRSCMHVIRLTPSNVSRYRSYRSYTRQEHICPAWKIYIMSQESITCRRCCTVALCGCARTGGRCWVAQYLFCDSSSPPIMPSSKSRVANRKINAPQKINQRFSISRQPFNYVCIC